MMTAPFPLSNRVLVTGGRDYNDTAFLVGTLNEFHETTPITLLIHGAARGADRIANEWAARVGIPVAAYPALWTRYKLCAGPIRNREMLLLGKPDVVIAFKGNSGTRDMMDISRRAGIKVIETHQ